MSKSVRTVLAVTGVLGVAGLGLGVAKYVGLVGDPAGPRTGVAPVLPLTCRLRGHGWKMPRNHTQTPTRQTCPKCQLIDVPMP